MANPNPPKPLSIEAAGGIEAFLDLPQNREIHNGHGSKYLKNCLKYEMPISKIMKAYNVKSSNTVKDWIRRLNEISPKQTS